MQNKLILVSLIKSILIIFIVFPFSLADANTRSDIMKHFPHNHIYLERVTIDVYVITVNEVAKTTHDKDYFVVECELNEVLRGENTSSTIQLKWRPLSLLPQSGQSFLVFVNAYNTIPIIVDAYMFTPEIKQQVADNLRFEDINYIVLLILLTIPLASLRLFFMFLFKPTLPLETMRTRSELIVIITLSVLSYLAYLKYNESVPIDYNIRVDLLVIYPLVIVASVNSFIAFFVLIWTLKK